MTTPKKRKSQAAKSLEAIRNLRETSNHSIVRNQVTRTFGHMGATLSSGRGGPKLHLWVIVDADAPNFFQQREFRSIKSISTKALQKAIEQITTQYHDKVVGEETMEIFQDLVFSEINHRLQRGVHS